MPSRTARSRKRRSQLDSGVSLMAERPLGREARPLVARPGRWVVKRGRWRRSASASSARGDRYGGAALGGLQPPGAP